jgi:hypothetical protein
MLTSLSNTMFESYLSEAGEKARAQSEIDETGG